ncbi:2'-5' RNA ligase family protein [Luedemannella flava]|uniref:2'-5' RNA ligase family protein n=1 Tax=Luedemannella flava TaxID=349316 RepID=A0ABN2LLT7_9ACTN
MTPTETALIVAVPEAEPAVGVHRDAYDAAAGWGVPAHVTVLYPFLAPDRIDHEVLAGLSETFAAHRPFEATLASVGWFGDQVVYLAPEPDDRFRALTAAVWDRFPQAPPYGGAFDDVVPHLTIGHDHPRPLLAAAADQVAAHLPVHASVRAVRLIAGSRGAAPWRRLAEFPLG